jgi:hypothetical protein
MKLKFSSILAALLLCGAVSIALPTAFGHAADQPGAASFPEYSAIRKVMGLYIQAGKEANSSIMKPAFHKDAIMYGTAGTDVTGGPIQGLFDYMDSNPKASRLESEIASIEIVNNIAYVRIESNNWNGARYSDMFLLLKDDNGWKIITKTYFDHK